MSQYNVSTQVSFWSTDIIIGEVLSASCPDDNRDYFALEGQKIDKAFPGQRQSLEDFGNRYLLRAANGQWIEFAYA
jgi:hypothetical protein